jgi:hypothetical protein
VPTAVKSRMQQHEWSRDPTYSITSSATNWRGFGTSRPSARTVCMFMTNSHLVVCKTNVIVSFDVPSEQGQTSLCCLTDAEQGTGDSPCWSREHCLH